MKMENSKTFDLNQIYNICNNYKHFFDFNNYIRLTLGYSIAISKPDFICEIKIKKETRTNSQNNSIWLFCTWIATLFNDSGELYITPLGIEIPWTKDLIMEIYWRPLQKQLYKKKSTSKLKTDEVSPIAQAIIMHMAKKGYDIEFPNWQSFLNKIDAKNYQHEI